MFELYDHFSQMHRFQSPVFWRCASHSYNAYLCLGLLAAFCNALSLSELALPMSLCVSIKAVVISCLGLAKLHHVACSVFSLSETCSHRGATILIIGSALAGSRSLLEQVGTAAYLAWGSLSRASLAALSLLCQILAYLCAS